ncbi:MAG: flagellar assembly protein FliW [Nitrospirae bacterium]|nr:flagellar assembly protein FliW [Nitrospirota bacterium]
MIQLSTSRFGVLEVDEDKIINFPSGLVGLPEIKRYILIDHKDTPVKWLQAVDDPDIAFIVVSPTLIVADYDLSLDKSVKQHIQLENNDDLAVLVTMRVNDEDVIANFQGPIVINSRSKKGVQVILDNAGKTYHEVVV